MVDYVPKPIKNAAGKAFLEAKNSVLVLYDDVKNTLKGDVENQKQTEDNTDLTPHENEGNNYIRVEMPFNSLMREFFEDGDISELMQHMLAHIKTQVENPQMTESGFALDRIMYLYINILRLALTRGSSYIDFREWIKGKKAVLNPQNEDEECKM